MIETPLSGKEIMALFMSWAITLAVILSYAIGGIMILFSRRDDIT